MWLMVKMWDIAVVEYWKNGTTLYVAYGQNVGRLGYGIWESGTTLDVAYGQMWDDAVMEYGKWDNIRHGLWWLMVKMWDNAVIEYGKWDYIRRGLWSKGGTLRL